MKILITGGNGYIGSHLATALVEKGHTLHALIYPGTDASKLLEQGIKVFTGDIRDYNSVERAAKGCEQVYHLASYVSLWASKPGIFYDINVEGTRNLLNVCRNNGIWRILISSSCGIFGPSQHGEMVNEKSNYVHQLKGDYELSKFQQVEVARNYMDDGLDIVCVYPTRVFGLGIKSAGNYMSLIFEGALKGPWRFIPGNGKSVGNYIFVKDVIEGMMLVMEKGENGEDYILGGHNVSYDELLSMILEASQQHFHFTHIPYPVMWFAGAVSELYAKVTGKRPIITRYGAWKFNANWKVSSDKVRQSLAFEPTPMRDAIQATVDGILNGETIEANHTTKTKKRSHLEMA